MFHVKHREGILLCSVTSHAGVNVLVNATGGLGRTVSRETCPPVAMGLSRELFSD